MSTDGPHSSKGEGGLARIERRDRLSVEASSLAHPGTVVCVLPWTVRRDPDRRGLDVELLGPREVAREGELVRLAGGELAGWGHDGLVLNVEISQ